MIPVQTDEQINLYDENWQQWSDMKKYGPTSRHQRRIIHPQLTGASGQGAKGEYGLFRKLIVQYLYVLSSTRILHKGDVILIRAEAL